MKNTPGRALGAPKLRKMVPRGSWIAQTGYPEAPREAASRTRFLNKKQQSEQTLSKHQQSEQNLLFNIDSTSIFRWFLNEHLNKKQQSEQKCLFDIDFQMLLRSSFSNGF